MMSITELTRANLLTRADVRVQRNGYVIEKATDSVVGVVGAGKNAAGGDIWLAHTRDMSSFGMTRDAAIARVIDLHNCYEKARAYDLIARKAGA